MAYGQCATETADINLDNYFLDHQFYNTYVYVHKKFLPKTGINKKHRHDVETHCNIITQNISDKTQQHDEEKNIIYNFSEKKKARTNPHDDYMMEQTVKFAKDLIPKIIPPSREFSPTPVFYNIKTSKKSGKKLSKPSSSHIEFTDNAAYQKDKSKAAAKKMEIKKVDIYEDENLKEVTSHSSQDNTSEEFQINQSSNFSVSEILDDNGNKTALNLRKRKHDHTQRNINSESFEAVTTEINNLNQANVKIHLMSESEKKIFLDSLTDPIINSVKEYLNELNKSSEVIDNLQSLQKSIDSNTQKIDYLVQLLQNIEKKTMNHTDKSTKIIMSPKLISSKASRLEELADLSEIEEGTDVETNYDSNVYRKTMTTKSAVVTMSPNHKPNKTERSEHLGRGEEVPIHSIATCSQLAVKPDRPIRIPARFCWTDTT